MLYWYLKEGQSIALKCLMIYKLSRLRHHFAKRNVHTRNITIYGGDDLSKLVVGKNVTLDGAFLDIHDTITIGDEVAFGPQVKVFTGSHNFRELGKERQKTISKPVVIKRGAWIASFSIILPGTEIGEYSVVSAGSVVRGKIPPYK